ncbi:MAG: hypothetical protein A3F17_00030 [Gammaproteobacteria bacterium RIFCSPHIGHO2_12_FULL_41_15]|nr:MAG: hypothetical protein A3F17_00030 [Gammaproteobacteria bacterium RIFCSPHIGHO2_12_FULL_41_15]
MSLVTTTNKRWWIFSSFALVFIIINLDLTIVNVALPTIARAMHSTLSQMQWVMNIFTLVMTCLIIIFGNLCDKYGSVRVYIWGNVLFMLGSLVSGISLNEPMLIAARIVQAAGMASIFTPCMLIPLSYFPDNQRGFIISCILSVSGISMAIGPNVGGLILEHLSWRWIFFINVPLGIITIFMTRRLCEKDTVNNAKQIDYLSSIFLTITITLMLVGFNNMNGWGLNSARFVATMAGSAIAATAFVFSQKNKATKTIDFSTFKIRSYWSVFCIRLLFSYCFFVVLFITPFYLQNIMEMTPSQSALILIFMSGTFGFMSPFVGRMCDRVGIAGPAKISTLAAIFGFAIMAFIGPHSSIYLTIISLFCIGFATALIVPSTARVITHVLPKDKAGNGLAVYFTAGFLGGSIGIGLSVSILAMISRNFFLKTLKQFNITLPSDVLNSLLQVVNGTHPVTYVSQYVDAVHLEKIKAIVKLSYMQGYSFTAWTMCGFCVLCFLLTYFIEEIKTA